MFDESRGLVVLVEKNRPAWQAGLLNGVGGKIEPGESAYAAMVREFREEAAVRTAESEWINFATLIGPDFTVFMMRAFTDHMFSARTMESERIARYPVTVLKSGAYPTVRNLPFLLPLALDKSGIKLPVVLFDSQSDEANAA